MNILGKHLVTRSSAATRLSTMTANQHAVMTMLFSSNQSMLSTSNAFIMMNQ
jgi:hypothetical protein